MSERKSLFDARPQEEPKPGWAVALDRMRTSDGRQLDHEVTLTSSEAFAFVTHYLEQANALRERDALLLELRSLLKTALDVAHDLNKIGAGEGSRPSSPIAPDGPEKCGAGRGSDTTGAAARNSRPTLCSRCNGLGLTGERDEWGIGKPCPECDGTGEA